MEVAPEHAEAVREPARIGVEERLLFDRVALDPTDVAPGHVELPTAIEADLPHAERAIREGALEPAGVTADPPLVQSFPEVAFAGVGRQDVGERRHTSIVDPRRATCT